MAVIPAAATVDGDAYIPDGYEGDVIVNEDFGTFQVGLNKPSEIDTQFQTENNVSFLFRIEGSNNVSSSESASDDSTWSSKGIGLMVDYFGGNRALKISKTSTGTPSVLNLAIGLTKGQTDWLQTESETSGPKIQTGIVKFSADIAFEKNTTTGKYLPYNPGTAPFLALAYKTNNNNVSALTYDKNNDYVLQTKGTSAAAWAAGSEALKKVDNTMNHVDMYVDYTGATPKSWIVLNGEASTKFDVVAPSGEGRNATGIAHAVFALNSSATTTGYWIDNIKVTHYTEAEVIPETPADAVEITVEEKIDVTEGTENENGLGVAITIADAKAFTEMIWVFATGNTADDRWYSAPVAYPGAVEGDVTIAAAFRNGDRTANDSRTVTGVDAIFKTADGTEYYTNQIDKANKLN